MVEMLTVTAIQKAERERAYEYGLPEYLQHDLDAYKEGLKSKSDLLDCLWGELSVATGRREDYGTGVGK